MKPHGVIARLTGSSGSGAYYRSGAFNGYINESGIIDSENWKRNLTKGMTMSVCEVVASTLVQVVVYVPSFEIYCELDFRIKIFIGCVT